MATITFSTLPPEIHVNIAKHCENSDLVKLCLTSRSIKERCLDVLYRHVILEPDEREDIPSAKECPRMIDIFRKQQQLVHTLLNHPEYGKQVRVFKGPLNLPSLNYYCHRLKKDRISEAELWRAMESLTQVQRVDVGSRNGYAYCMTVNSTQIPSVLFQSTTSVRLVGYLQYNLAKSILDRVNPAILKDLSLDMVQDRTLCLFQHEYQPGDIGEDGRVVARGSISGLLTALTGRCAALQTLVLRRIGQVQDGAAWHAAAEEKCYTQWASFISSVQGTVERFTFGQAGKMVQGMTLTTHTASSRIMDDRFQRLILPAIISGNWPRLISIELQGVRYSNGRARNSELTKELRAVLGGSAKIVVTDQPEFVLDTGREFTVNR
ncbi:hypothetical protein MMC07_004290 [Pseudocyphellaria aurata]|nr:hypothetical protein [Pseudocyphellaria aurata]